MPIVMLKEIALKYYIANVGEQHLIVFRAVRFQKIREESPTQVDDQPLAVLRGNINQSEIFIPPPCGCN